MSFPVQVEKRVLQSVFGEGWAATKFDPVIQQFFGVPVKQYTKCGLLAFPHPFHQFMVTGVIQR